ncbi:MAG: tetratricopeptide repeat protein [Beijerinckiaceae bacterium]
MRIFISAVTSGFDRARAAVASDLRARGHDVTIQSDFRQSPDSETLLGALADYIRDCHAVICVIGKRSGAFPPKRAADRYPDVLPEEIKEASYTQWEYFLARYYNRRRYRYIANDDYKPDRDSVTGDRADLQSDYVKFLKADGVHYEKFSTAEQLRIAVMRDEPKIAAQSETLTPPTKPIVLPYPSIGDLFKGRNEFMARLHQSLMRAGGGQRAVALYGLGGVGKTRMAVEYARAHVDAYTALLFAVAETPEALRRNLAALSVALVPKLDTTDDEVRLAAVLDWLKVHPGWFLILDNADSKPARTELERLLSEVAGHVLVTSRLADFSGNFLPLELDVLAVEDAAAFLLARTEDRRRVVADDAAKAREVAEELGGLALMLEQAAAFIAKRRLTLVQYLDQWRSKRSEALEWFDETVTGYPRAVAVTWETSVAQLSEGGRQLLERLAWLAPEKVPETLIDVPIPGAEDENLREAFDDLAAYSLVTRDAEGPFFLVHRLVQDVTRRSLAGEVRQRSLVEALDWINAAFPFEADDVRFWPIANSLAPHARAVITYADDAGIVESTSRLMNQLGILFETKALHAEAEPLYRRAIEIDENTFGPDHPRIATHLGNLALTLKETNRAAEAEPLMRRALAIDEEEFGPDHPSVATALSNLAALLCATNRLAEAEPLMRRALAIDEKSFGLDHSQVAIRLNNLAELLRATKRLAEAEPLYRRALLIDEKTFGAHHPHVAIDLNNLALLLKATNRQAEAEPVMRRVISIFEKTLGQNHPNIATAYNNLARLLQDTSRFDDAEPLMRRALTIDETSFGSDHPKVAIRLNNLALLLLATNRLDEAEPLTRRHVAIFVEFTRRTGHPHPHLDDAFANYAGLLAVMGKGEAEIEAACDALMRPLSGNPSS